MEVSSSEFELCGYVPWLSCLVTCIVGCSFELYKVVLHQLFLFGGELSERRAFCEQIKGPS
jgi:hypothetical protein